MNLIFIAVICAIFGLTGCKKQITIQGSRSVALTADSGVQPTRLRIVNGCNQPLWIFYQSGYNGGTIPTPHQIQLAINDHIDYPIPDRGLAGFRWWPGYGCDSTGNNCRIGQSGGPSVDGFTCPAWGCAPPIDSKFEGTFGCLSSVSPALCQINPSDPRHSPLPDTDSWDTSGVDGFTLPYRVRVVSGTCSRGPINNEINCHSLSMSMCPQNENLSTNGQFPTLASVDMRLSTPVDAGQQIAGCYSDCSRLTMNQWGGLNYTPNDSQALWYCCPTPPMSSPQCQAGPVAQTDYTQLVHRQCPQVYAYAYDDGTGLWNCNAGAKYEVTFYCPQ